MQTTEPRRYRLRWRFDFASRPSRFGIWNNSGARPEDGAWRVPKDGLVRACIEAECALTFKTTVLVDVPGPDYVTALWEAFARSTGGVQNQDGSVRLRTSIAGLSFLTRTEKITVWMDGRVERRPLTAEEAVFDQHEHTAGT
jgi:hypothetical protein